MSGAPGGPARGDGPPEHFSSWLSGRLFDRRVVVLAGPLDDQRVQEVAAGLMTLDAEGDGAVELRIDCPGGPVGSALALIDVLDLLGVPVRAHCTGQAVGAAVGVLAVCSFRTIAPHARIHLRQPRASATGSAVELLGWADGHARQWDAFCHRLAEATGQTVERVEEDAADGRVLTAEEAVAYGLADEIAAPGGPQGAARPSAE